jgi:tetratricopeptide (TPR) repeat protein
MATGLKVFAIAVILAALAVTSLSQSQSDSTQSINAPKTFALVVGISKYTRLPGGQQIQFADRDATLFADAIRKAGVKAENLRVLTGAEATVPAIKAALGNWLARAATENDTVLIFFSGHGLYENEFNESYLLGYDSDAKDPFSTALLTSEINQALTKRIRSRRVLILADAMRKDFFDPESIGSAASSFIRAFNQIATSRAGVSVIMANGPGEFSREGQRWSGQGVFTRYLVDAMSANADRNGDGSITADELFDTLAARVAEDTSNKQHPWHSESALAQIALTSVERSANISAPVAKLEPVAKPTASTVSAPKPVEATKPAIDSPRTSTPKTETIVAERKPEPAPKATETSTKKVEAPPRPAASTPKATVNPETTVARNEPSAPSTKKPVETAAPSPQPRAPAPPKTQKVAPAQSSSESPVIASTNTTEASSPPPRPEVTPPGLNPVGASSERNPSASVSASVPVIKPETAPTPLALQLVVAITSKNLVEPKNTSAWDLYQKLMAEPTAAADLARLKPMLADALADSGRAIVVGDVRADNISDRVEDFRRAGQMLARARSLKPDSADIASLEKLSAAQALIALQFYDEAERALTPLQNSNLAAVHNALGLVYQGKLDSWRAERAFKRASELDGKWATPHYNLALFYRSQQNEAALSELESAAALDATNPGIFVAIGDECFSKQQWQRAAEAFRKAIALKPADDVLHTKLGHALYSQGLQAEANREYQKAKELRSKQP